MNRAAGWAAVGSGLLALFYFVTNGVPLLGSLDAVSGAAVIRMFVLLLAPPLIWIWFFARLWRGEPAGQMALLTLLTAVAPQAVYSWVEQWAAFSLLSLDSILYLFSGVFLPVAYAWFLTGIFREQAVRRVAYFAWVLTTFQAMWAVFSAVSVWLSVRGSLAAFWNNEPLATFWKLFAGPAILIVYWGSQSYFFKIACRRDVRA